MRILYLTDQIYLHGGAEKILIQKLNCWVEFYGYEIKLITTQQLDNEPFFELNKNVQFTDLGINYYDGVSFYNPKNFLKVPLHYFKLKSEIECFNPNAIFVISRSFVRYFAPLIARKYRIYNEYHTSYYSSKLAYDNSGFLTKVKFKVTDFILKIIESFYTKIILLNQEEFSYYKFNNAVIIPNFFNETTKEIQNIKENKVISLGRLCHQKGYDMLIDAWEIVDIKIENWELHIYGNGPDLNILKNKIKSKVYKNPIHLKPAINDINEKLSTAAFYVMSSRFETFPMVLLEAMSNKLPVVSFNCPSGPKSILTPNEDSLLAKSMDISDLANKIYSMINNDLKRKEMSEKAFINVKKFNAKKIMEQWDELIKLDSK